MTTNFSRSFLSLVVIAVITTMGMPVPAFSGGPDPKENNIETDTMVICSEPRPQICTREYRPVCAQMKDGSFKTYATGCTSCSDSNVVGYRDGACEEAK